MVDQAEKTITEVVKVLDDGRFEVIVGTRAKNGAHATASFSCKVGRKDYAEFTSKHGNLKPGQVSTIVRTLHNGEWTYTQEISGGESDQDA